MQGRLAARYKCEGADQTASGRASAGMPPSPPPHELGNLHSPTSRQLGQSKDAALLRCGLPTTARRPSSGAPSLPPAGSHRTQRTCPKEGARRGSAKVRRPPTVKPRSRRDFVKPRVSGESSSARLWGAGRGVEGADPTRSGDQRSSCRLPIPSKSATAWLIFGSREPPPPQP